MAFPSLKGRSEFEVTVAAATWIIPLPVGLIAAGDLIVLYAVGSYGTQTIFGHPVIDTGTYPGWGDNGQSIRGYMGRTCVRRKIATGSETEVGLTWEDAAIGTVLIEVWEDALNSLERTDLFGVFGGMLGATGEFQASPGANNPVHAPGGQMIVQDPPSSGDYIGRTDLDAVYIAIRFGTDVKPSGPPPPEVGDVNFVNLYSTTPAVRPITTAHYFAPNPQTDPAVGDGISYPLSNPGTYTHWINSSDDGWISMRFVLVRASEFGEEPGGGGGGGGGGPDSLGFCATCGTYWSATRAGYTKDSYFFSSETFSKGSYTTAQAILAAGERILTCPLDPPYGAQSTERSAYMGQTPSGGSMQRGDDRLTVGDETHPSKHEL